MPMKTVVLVHRGRGTTESDWYPWLSGMLVRRGFKVLAPQMPDADEPRISAWVQFLSEIVEIVGKETFFVGHGIGCQTIIRYLETIEKGVEIGGVFFVAGWFHLSLNSLETEEERRMADEWTGTPIDLGLAREHLPRSVALFSNNDRYVPLSDLRMFMNGLGSRIIIHPKRGHFTEDDRGDILPPLNSNSFRNYCKGCGISRSLC